MKNRHNFKCTMKHFYDQKCMTGSRGGRHFTFNSKKCGKHFRSATIEAWKFNFPQFNKIMTDRTNWPTDWRTGGVIISKDLWPKHFSTPGRAPSASGSGVGLRHRRTARPRPLRASSSSRWGRWSRRWEGWGGWKSGVREVNTHPL